jgi:hypothetical protein
VGDVWIITRVAPRRLPKRLFLAFTPFLDMSVGYRFGGFGRGFPVVTSKMEDIIHEWDNAVQ